MYKLQAKGNKTAELFIYEDVGESLFFGGVTAKQIAEDLKKVGDVEQIDVRINSYGGDVFEGLAIYNQLVRNRAKVVTHIDGIAASIASIIAMAGNEIFIAENGFIMIHNAWGAVMGDSNTLRDYAERLDAVTAELTQVYVARTKLDSKAVTSMMDKETWLDAGDAIDKGFADKMSENLRIAARYEPEKHKFRNIPKAVMEERPEFDQARRRIVALTERMPAAQRARLLQARGVG